MTGHLSALGDGLEFDNADDFLYPQLDLNPPNGNFVGLHHTGWRDYAIPGNHDHWPGARPSGAGLTPP